ncbi:MAG: regulatory protein RecX [Candidatus Methylomirabilia bacterium]
MKRPLSVEAAKRAAYDLLSRKAWSRRELTARLVQRGAPETVARDVVAELEARGYVDDQAFARQWAERRTGRRSLGSRRLSAELDLKGIARSQAASAIREAFSGTGEEAQALEAGRRRLAALQRQNPGRAPVRLRDYLLRRGYPPEIVSQVMRRLVKLEDSDAESVPGSPVPRS